MSGFLLFVALIHMGVALVYKFQDKSWDLGLILGAMFFIMSILVDIKDEIKKR